MLELRNFHIGYKRGLEVVKGVSLILNPGETTVLLGPNGSGKSTLIKGAVGAIKINQGSLILDGKAIEKPSERASVISYVPQKAELPALSVYETILMGRLPIFGYAAGKEDHEATRAIIEKFGLAELAAKNAHELSGGEAQKVMVARALVSNPKAIFFDEPTSSLDIANQMLVLNEIKSITKEGIIVLIAMHDINLALGLGQKFYCLKSGEIISEGGTESIVPELMERLYGVHAEIHEGKNRNYIHFGD
ncbi:MAG: ABC transporter ATP-binding protein [Bacilli bacterium]|nr:ABC transporter ATP-binding protein [Bacilli bacterium]